MRLLAVCRQAAPGVDLARETHPQHPGVGSLREGAGVGESQVERCRPSRPSLPPLQLPVTLVWPAVAEELERHVPSRRWHPPQLWAGGPKAVDPLVEVLLHLWRQQ